MTEVTRCHLPLDEYFIAEAKPLLGSEGLLTDDWLWVGPKSTWGHDFNVAIEVLSGDNLMLLPQARRVGLILLCLCWVAFVANAQNNEVVSISGTLLMLDEKTPHVAVPVQVVALLFLDRSLDGREAGGEGDS